MLAPRVQLIGLRVANGVINLPDWQLNINGNLKLDPSKKVMGKKFTKKLAVPFSISGDINDPNINFSLNSLLKTRSRSSAKKVIKNITGEKVNKIINRFLSNQMFKKPSLDTNDKIYKPDNLHPLNFPPSKLIEKFLR